MIPRIKGIQVTKHELKISQYADNTTVIVRDLDYVASLLKVLNHGTKNRLYRASNVLSKVL